MTWRRASLEPFALRLKQPLTTARGALHERRGWLLRLMDDSGREGLGTAMPIDGFGGESFRDCGIALAEALAAGSARVAHSMEHAPFGASALELACLDLEARHKGVPLAGLLTQTSGGGAKTVPVNALLGEMDTPALIERVRSLRDHVVLKLKVGADVDIALAKVEAACGAMSSNQRLRVDPNASWGEADARRALIAMTGWPIDYVEQPTASTSELARLRHVSPVDLAADESACDLAGLREVLSRQAADVIVVKPMRAGGPATALALAREAQAAGLDVVITSLLDSAVGVRAALSVALALGPPPRACGLETAQLFERDWLPAPVSDCGRMPGWHEPGIGAVLDASAHDLVSLEHPRTWSRPAT